MNLGIDFGSTYTMVSEYRVAHDRLEAYEEQGSAQIPSVVAFSKYDEEEIDIGQYAKDKTGKRRGVVTLKAFKMLLTEKNDEFLKNRHYDDKHTPQWAATQFMKKLIYAARNNKEIDNLVIGAPEVWFHNISTLGGRAILRDICKDIDGVNKGKVRIISEPVLASAYYAYNYQKTENKPFEGNLLIIDYGGGTLDLSLTEIKNVSGKAAEIRLLESNGAGENTDHTVGNAGIVYMESLMEHVIRKNTPEIAEQMIGTPEFQRAVNDLEIELKYTNRQDTIKKTFKRFGTENYDLLEKFSLGNIDCGAQCYSITFSDMLKVYDQIIRPVFDEKMNQMIQWAREIHDIDVYAVSGDKFKIALVGGFGNFYLVRNQMEEKFGFADVDVEDRGIGVKEKLQDCERAISYGAALIASGVFDICNTAPYSFGISFGGDDSIDYMVHYNDEIQLNHPYYIMRNKDSEKPFVLGKNWGGQFIIDYGRTDPEKRRYRAKDEFIRILENMIKNDLKVCGIGISFSDSAILSIHIKEYDYHKRTFAKTDTSLELGKLEDAFIEEGKR